MAQSKTTKRFFNMAYGIGAAIVIVGALFKIQHWDYGSEILTIGMLVEAIVFFISAFDAVEEDLDWTKVYPELSGTASRGAGLNGMLSQKLDNLLKEAQIDSKLITSLGTNIKSFQTAAEGLSVASESISSTTKYNEQVELAAIQMKSLNGLYQSQLETSSKQSKLNDSIVENSEYVKEQLESLANNLSTLNGVYGGMLSAMSSK